MSLPVDRCPGYGIDASLCGKAWERALKPNLWLPTVMYRMGLPSGLEKSSPLTLSTLQSQVYVQQNCGLAKCPAI